MINNKIMKESNIERPYSEFGQDVFVLELLDWKRNGFFLDSGAADGLMSSNTYLLEHSYDWKGICVEPNESFFKRLTDYRNCYCLNYCLYDKEQYVDFLEAGNILGGIVEEYHPSHLDYLKKQTSIENPSFKMNSVTKLTRTISQVLKECNAPKNIDYWSLDTEGSELSILKSFPFEDYAVSIITVEHNHYPIRNEINKFLESRGYERIREFGVDDCYMLA